MRAVIWFLALFAIAVASALFAGNNQATVALFWPPYRVDVSLNLVLLSLFVLFLTLYVALRTIAALFSLPGAAKRWRMQHLERALSVGLLDSLAHLTAGRFLRARKSAQSVLDQEAALVSHDLVLPYAGRLRAMSHLLAAESAHALQDRTVRDEHLMAGLEQAQRNEAAETAESLALRAARWAFDDRDAQAALQRLDQLPQGVSRRTLALRLRFKVARFTKQTAHALELARLLTKHRAFSPMAGQSIARGLALEMIRLAHDPSQMVQAWSQLEPVERNLPDVAIAAADRLLQVGGDVVLAQSWLLTVWDSASKRLDALTLDQRIALVLTLELSFEKTSQSPDVAWLKRIESAQMANPQDPVWMYLAGVTCMRLALWGKSQQLLKQALPQLQHARLLANSWRALARLAEQRDDAAAAAAAWRNAALQQ
jgi:HemY protein